MKVKFQADADLSHIILYGVIRREPAIDFQTATDARLERKLDLHVLEIAAESGRILVTHDKKTMPEQFARFIPAQESPGVLIVPQHLPVYIAIEEIIIIWSVTEAEEWVNRIVYLPL
ncbi:MAG: DUF5615 family PIN-like protein [Anaerolineae bacterium]